MKQAFLVFLFVSLTLLASSQSKCSINKAMAFYTETYPGMQMADQNGNPIAPKATVERQIYIEWCGAKKPEITEVLYDNRPFSVVLEKINGRSVIAGKDLSPENKTRITAAKCKQLWKLIVIPKDGKEAPEPGAKQILIKTKSPRACVFKINTETRLKTLPRP
jgi:hypothetical protein